jgi:hypothetical protein
MIRHERMCKSRYHDTHITTPSLGGRSAESTLPLDVVSLQRDTAAVKATAVLVAHQDCRNDDGHGKAGPWPSKPMRGFSLASLCNLSRRLTFPVCTPPWCIVGRIVD